MGCLGCVKLLVQGGAAIDAQDERGKTALWYAATPESYSPAGGSQLLEFLAKSGADLELADNTGTTPLAWARKSPGRAETYREIAEDLVRLGATK